MPSYLFVAFLSRGTFFEIQAFQYGVFAELFLDFQNGGLHFPFFVELLLFLRIFSCV